VRRIVFGYDIDFFPGLLIVGCNQLKRKLERAGFDVRVGTFPLDHLPPDTDIIFVPSELDAMARKAAPQCRIESLDSLLNHPAYNQLVEQLERGTEWTAPPLAAHSDEEGQIMQYRGYQRID
jgi:mannitol-specific phosphotransferase system IIBC component